jgi:hypothetical protein
MAFLKFAEKKDYDFPSAKPQVWCPAGQDGEGLARENKKSVEKS